MLLSRALDICWSEGITELLDDTVDYLSECFPVQPTLLYRRYTARIKYDVSAYPQKIYWVDPDQIVYAGPLSDREHETGTVKPGDWDQNCSMFTGHSVYQGPHKRFIEGPLGQQQVLSNTKEKARTQWNSLWIRLLNSFLKNIVNTLPNCVQLPIHMDTEPMPNYRKQAVITTDINTIPTRRRMTHETGCNVSWDGALLCNSEYYRLIIAKILDPETIPVHIVVRDSQ